MKFCGKVVETKKDRRAVLELRCVKPEGHNLGPCECVWHVASGKLTVDTEAL